MFKLFARFRKDRPRLLCGEPFVAAYSEYPFLEMKHGSTYPDCVFQKKNGLYWCIRIGEIEIPWAFVDDSLGFGANGSLIVRRRNVDSTSFDMKGIAQTRIGDVTYIFVNYVSEDGRQGYAKYLAPRLHSIFREIAERSGSDGFTKAVQDELLSNSQLCDLLNEHEMVLKTAVVDAVKIHESPEKE